MSKNTIKEILRQGGYVHGVMVFEFATTGIGRISAAAGAQFAVFDMEHTGWTLETIRMLIATSRSTDLVPIVRVPTMDYHHIAHVMDVGAKGIVIPLVQSADQLREAISYAQYPPLGRRGCGFGLSHDDYRSGDIVKKMKEANEDLLIVAQIETPEGVANVEEIVSVPGVDAIWVGQYDLSATMGIPGQFDHPELIAACKRVHEVCLKHNVVSVLANMDVTQLANGPANGHRMLVYVGDLWIYQQALRNCFETIQKVNAYPNTRQR